MGAGTQTTTTQAEPYGPAKPLLNTAIKDAKSLYRQGIGNKAVPFSRASKQGMNDIMANARANMGPNGLNAQYQSIIDNGGMNATQMDALNQFKSLANSSYDMNANPGFADILAKAQNDARNAVNMNAAAAGRYGSDIAQGAVAREVGNTTANMLSNDYNNWLQRRDAAVSNQYNAGQQGMQNLSTAYAGMQDPAKAALSVGQMREAMANNRINAPWQNINRLMGIGNMTQAYAPSQTTSPGPNSFLGTLGNVATGYGLLGGMGLF